MVLVSREIRPASTRITFAAAAKPSVSTMWVESTTSARNRAHACPSRRVDARAIAASSPKADALSSPVVSSTSSGPASVRATLGNSCRVDHASADFATRTKLRDRRHVHRRRVRCPRRSPRPLRSRPRYATVADVQPRSRRRMPPKERDPPSSGPSHQRHRGASAPPGSDTGSDPTRQTSRRSRSSVPRTPTSPTRPRHPNPNPRVRLRSMAPLRTH